MLFPPHFLFLTWLCLQGVSHKGHVSKPPVPEEREANRLHGEAVKKKKDAAKQAATRKRERKEKHEKECKIALAEGRLRPATPESTEEEDSSDVEINFSDDDKVVTGAESLPVYPRADDEGSSAVLGEARLMPRSLAGPPTMRTEQRPPAPVAGQRSPTPAAGRRSSTPVTGQRSPQRRWVGHPRPRCRRAAVGPWRVRRRPGRWYQGARPTRGRHPRVSRREVSMCRGLGGAAQASAV